MVSQEATPAFGPPALLSGRKTRPDVTANPGSCATTSPILARVPSFSSHPVTLARHPRPEDPLQSRCKFFFRSQFRRVHTDSVGVSFLSACEKVQRKSPTGLGLHMNRIVRSHRASWPGISTGPKRRMTRAWKGRESGPYRNIRGNSPDNTTLASRSPATAPRTPGATIDRIRPRRWNVMIRSPTFDVLTGRAGFLHATWCANSPAPSGSIPVFCHPRLEFSFSGTAAGDLGR